MTIYYHIQRYFKRVYSHKCCCAVMGKEQITLTKSELKRVMVLENWIGGRLAEQDVARLLGISIRQAYRLKAWTSVVVGSGAGLTLCGDAGHTDPSANNGQKRSGACVPPQARCKPSFEKCILQQAITA